jgi:hypothetical protein
MKIKCVLLTKNCTCYTHYTQIHKGDNLKILEQVIKSKGGEA